MAGVAGTGAVVPGLAAFGVAGGFGVFSSPAHADDATMRALAHQPSLDTLHFHLRSYFDLGTAYTMIAGLLNVLAVYDAWGGPVFAEPAINAWLAADLERHLNHEPILARPPSTVYRLQKAVRRHRLAFAAGAVVILALLIMITDYVFGFLFTQIFKLY